MQQSPSVTPKKRVQSRTTASSPLSKASTPDKQRAGTYLEDASVRSSAGSSSILEEELAEPLDWEGHEEVGERGSGPPSVSEKCVLLRWAERRGRRLGLIGGRWADRAPRYFGDYSEEEPDSYLLLQDLLALHKRSCEGVSVTVLTDDAPFDPTSLVGEEGECDLDACHVESEDEGSGGGDEEVQTERWLLRQDLIAMAKRGDGCEVQVTALLDAEEEGAEVLAAALERVGVRGVEDNYSEEEPDAWLLVRDLENLAKRGAGSVEVTVLRDDAPPDASCMLWPRGSGHLDIGEHFGGVVDALCERLEGAGGADGEASDGELGDYLLLKDMISLQRAGVDQVGVVCVSEGQPEDVARLLRRGWEEGGLWEEPSAAFLAEAAY